MITRYLEKQVELSLNESIEGFNSTIRLEYYLLESELVDTEELSGQTTFGVEIVKRVDGLKDEEKRVINLSCCRGNAKSILDKLIYNTVTPIGLPYVLDDMIGA